VISVRRLMYLHTILKRHEDELTYKIYQNMKLNPLKDDWINLIISDLNMIEMTLDQEDEIRKFTKNDFKSIVKEKVRKFAFNILEITKSSHSKVKNILHTNLVKPQEYITSNLFSNKQSSLLFNLRSKCVNEFNGNFPCGSQHPMCKVCGKYYDTQEHALTCDILTSHMTTENRDKVLSVKYANLFAAPEDQLRIIEAFNIVIETRQRLQAPSGPRLPRHHMGPSG
jgi:hypothetical protein